MHPVEVRPEGRAGRIDGELGTAQDAPQGLGGGIRGAGAVLGNRNSGVLLPLLLLLLLEEVADVGVEPVALELGGTHVLGAADGAAAGGGVAEALEGLGHFPLGGGVEELR